MRTAGGKDADTASGNSKAPTTAPVEHVDPVCGKTVITDDAKPSIHDGEAYYFCSDDCRETFENAPSDYVGRGQQAPRSYEGHLPPAGGSRV
ncbi:MAG: YHS domain-containing protein [Rhodospirillales bacterium]